MAVEFKVLLAIVCICSTSISIYAHMSISREEDLELERQLKILNKPPLKTFQTQEGDVIDCVDTYKQPAFDHPLLKNHKIQLRPSYFPADSSKISSKVKSEKSINLRSGRETCPSRTVPIKRTTKEDLIRARSLYEPSSHSNANNVNLPAGHHMVNVRMNDNTAYGTRYYGGSARVSVYNLSIAPDQSSSATMWIQTESVNLNMITAGWKVSHKLFKDGNTRLYAYWTAQGDGHINGCYNTLCPGFVQVHKQFFLGSNLLPTSIPDGPQFDFKILIFQDRATGHWWLSVHNQNWVIGYWPKEIFPLLGNGAAIVAWGGVAHAGINGISPPMGNGNKPYGSYKHSAFYRTVNWIDDRNQSVYPKDTETSEQEDKSDCYGLKNHKYLIYLGWQYTFSFGGPGGYCG